MHVIMSTRLKEKLSYDTTYLLFSYNSFPFTIELVHFFH